MRKLRSVVFGLCVLGLVASHAFSLVVRVAPSTLVLSSGGGKLTVHTDVPFGEAEQVGLEVDGTAIAVRTFADSRGYLVAQCTKVAVVDAIGDFEGDTTTAAVTLIVDGESATEVIQVKK